MWLQVHYTLTLTFLWLRLSHVVSPKVPNDLKDDKMTRHHCTLADLTSPCHVEACTLPSVKLCQRRRLTSHCLRWTQEINLTRATCLVLHTNMKSPREPSGGSKHRTSTHGYNYILLGKPFYMVKP